MKWLKNLIPELELLTRNRQQPVFQAKEFSFAWNAIPVLAYSGFPSTIVDLKKDIENKLDEITVNNKKYKLAVENCGSMWPKVSLGALRDDRDISLSDAVKLRDICDEMTREIGTCPPIIIERLHFVVFECRSLERCVLSYPLPFKDRYSKDTNKPNSGLICQVIDQENEEYVKWVLGGFSRQRLTTYWEKGLLTGKSKESYYRGEHIEASLVVNLEYGYTDSIGRFIKKVYNALPKMYCWFSPNSWHITLRALKYV